jgi:hypothetical protein
LILREGTACTGAAIHGQPVHGGRSIFAAGFGQNAGMREPQERSLWTPGRSLVRLALATVVIIALPLTGRADDWQFGGHLKGQYSDTVYRSDDVQAQFGENPAHDESLDFRLKAEKRQGPWDFAIHYELLALHGDSLETRRLLAGNGFPVAGGVTGLPNDDRRLFNLTSEVIDRTGTAAVQRIDRLAVGYGTEHFLVRAGRQAVSWGNGLVFQPLDFLNPFSPIAVDKDYKTGDDMLYSQLQTGVQGDLQTVVVPRRDPRTHAVTGHDSSYAAKLRRHLAGFDVDVLAARHYDRNLFGIGVVHSLGGAVWRLDLQCNDIPGDTAWSLVTNLDYSWVLFGKNMYGFAEYFRNGLGETSAGGYASPNPELQARIARGELFTLARDYTALGLQVEVGPLVNVFANLIQNLDDASRFLQLRGVYDWRENTQLMAGLNLPAGERGSEYGGIPTAYPGTYYSPGRSVYLRAAWYF